MWVREFLNGAGVRARDIIKFDLDFLFCVIESMKKITFNKSCLLYTSPSPRDKRQSRMPSSA